MHTVKNSLPIIRKIVTMGFTAVVVLNLAILGEARPPSSIDLTYDKDKGSLHIVIKHVTENMTKHYIRKIEISKNNEPPVSHYYSHQTSASEMIVNVPLKARPKDTIHVKVVCSDAGRGEETLVIPSE